VKALAVVSNSSFEHYLPHGWGSGSGRQTGNAEIGSAVPERDLWALAVFFHHQLRR
jgi:hypothetical protein